MPRNHGAPVLALIALIVATPVAAQANEASQRLDAALVLFGQERFDESIEAFSRLLVDPRAESIRADAYYWSALAYIASGDMVNASKAIDAFLALYPANPKAQDLTYQRGRIAFLDKDYEKALSVFRAYLASAPSGELAGAAIFWSAESLFLLGRLDEAERLYRTVLAEHPKSVKVEAAGYRLSLIQYKYREEELLTLLKWSHEESLRVLEEFQRREKAYEQALAVYQRRLGESRLGLSTTQTELDARIEALESRAAELDAALAARDARIAELQGSLEGAKAAPAPAAAPVPAGPAEGAANAELLALKQEALGLLGFYLETLASGTQGVAP